MTYQNVKQTAERWGVSERRVTLLCRENRVFGAKKDKKTWLIPDTTEMPADGRIKKAESKKITQSVTTVRYTPDGAGHRAFEHFEDVYLKKPQSVAFTPYRICPLGAHSDHQLGKITGFAIDKGIYMAYGPKQNGVIEIQSLQFPKRAQWHVMEVPPQKENDWADHLRGATIALNSRYPLRVSMESFLSAGFRLPQL